MVVFLSATTTTCVTSFSLTFVGSPSSRQHAIPTALLAKKKKKALVSTAALDALDALDEDTNTNQLSKKELKKMARQGGKKDLLESALANEAALEENGAHEEGPLDPPASKKLSKKELRAAMKAGSSSSNAAGSSDWELEDTGATAPKLSKKEMRKALQEQQQQSPSDPVNGDIHANGVTNGKPALSKQERMLQKALELEAAATDQANGGYVADDSPKLSKKELKALKKKEAKMAEKLAKKEAKKAAAQQTADPSEPAAEPNGSTAAPASKKSLTLEDKIRKERPPPRIRVMEVSQPGYTSLRLENVGITFRNQEVLTDVTWGVQTGDRIGLVGANGAGTYLIDGQTLFV